MAISIRFSPTTSRPERREVTEELERRFREQEAAKEAAKSSAAHSTHAESPAQATR